MKYSFLFNYIIKAIWLLTFLLIIFIDRNNIFMVIFTISLLLFITFITVLRSLDSRNEWRKMIDEGDVEIKEKIKF
tara:strand:- start:445 stop:672 length:228 start_codon:yes stop_codon:yes gene_type:complete